MRPSIGQWRTTIDVHAEINSRPRDNELVWGEVAGKHRSIAYGDESDSAIDRAIFISHPHLVVAGIICAYIIDGQRLATVSIREQLCTLKPFKGERSRSISIHTQGEVAADTGIVVKRLSGELWCPANL